MARQRDPASSRDLLTSGAALLAVAALMWAGGALWFGRLARFAAALWRDAAWISDPAPALRAAGVLVWQGLWPVCLMIASVVILGGWLRRRRPSHRETLGVATVTTVALVAPLIAVVLWPELWGRFAASRPIHWLEVLSLGLVASLVLAGGVSILTGVWLKLTGPDSGWWKRP